MCTLVQAPELQYWQLNLKRLFIYCFMISDIGSMLLHSNYGSDKVEEVVSFIVRKYSRTSMAGTPMGP